MRVITVHGFGGRDDADERSDAMHRRVTELQIPVAVESFRWDSGNPKVLKTCAAFALISISTGSALNAMQIAPTVIEEWQRAKKETGPASKRLADQVTSSNGHVYLVGFSLGCELILNSLEILRERKIEVDGVFLCGAAVDADRNLSQIAASSRVGIWNYYSPKWDFVLATLFAQIELRKAAGQIGFNSNAGDALLRNLQVAESHIARSKLGRNAAYSTTVEGIVELAASFSGWHPVEASSNPQPTRSKSTMGGRGFWSDIVSRGGYRIQRGPTQLNRRYRLLDRSDRSLHESLTLAPLLPELERLSHGAPFGST